MTQYDDIAKEFQKIKQLPYYQIAEYTLLHHLGDIKGKSILDLACGEGFHPRRYKKLGAGRLVGVDVSTQMIELARQEEARNPLGIEYIVSPVEDLGKIGEFDIVVAIFLLNYAQTKEQLLSMCHCIYDNLKLGKRFLTITNNPDKAGVYPVDAFKEYGADTLRYINPEEEGSIIEVVLMLDGLEVKFNSYHHHKETYEWALREVGFQAITWHELSLPPHTGSDEVKFWQPLIESSSTILLECQK